MKKRILASLMAMIMAFGLMPASALAAQDEPSVMARSQEYSAEVYAVIVDANNKIIGIDTLTCNRSSAHTTHGYPDSGTEWSWTPNSTPSSTKGSYTLTATVTGSNSHTNRSVLVAYPGKLWNYSSPYSFLGYTKQNSYPTVGDKVSAKLSGANVSPLLWEKDKGNSSLIAGLSNTSKQSIWYVFRDTTPAVTYKDPQVNCRILYIDDSINPLGYRTSLWQKKSFTCALHGANCPDSVGSHSISVASVKAAAQELLAANVLDEGYELVGWTKEAGYLPDIKSFDAGGNIILSTKTNDDIYFVAKKPQTTDWSKLTIEKTASPADAVKPGDEITYTITVTNNTGKDLTDVQVTDKLPDALDFVSASPDGQYNATTGLWTIPSLAAGASATLTIKATVKDASGDTIRNTAAITGAKSGSEALPGGSGNTSTSDVTVDDSAPDLSITKTTDAENVKVGDTFEYTITVENKGSGSASNVVVKDILPDGLEYVSYHIDYPNSQNWEFTSNGQELTWTFKEIPAGLHVTITLTVKAVTADETGYENSAYIVGNENNPGTAEPVPVGAALTLTKTPNVKTVNVGEIFSYTLTVKNVSTAAVDNVEVNDVLPESLEFYAQSVQGHSGSCIFKQDEQEPQLLSWTFDTIPAGAEVTITLRVKALSAGKVKNIAAIVDGPETSAEDVNIVTPGKGILTIEKKVNYELDEDADFTFTLKRYILSENPSGEEALRTEDSTFHHDPIVVRVAKDSDTGSTAVELPEIPVGTVYTVAEEDLSDPASGNRELKMEGTTGVFSHAEYSCEMFFKDVDKEGNSISTSTGEMAPCDSFSALWPGQEITAVTITCTNTYELTAPSGTHPVTVKNSYAAPDGTGDYAANDTVTIHAGSRNNYSFAGWTVDGDDVQLADPTSATTTFTMPARAVTVTAKWKELGGSSSRDDDYTLRYVTNGGKAISSESKSRSWVKAYEDLPVPTRTGYLFDGWYYDSKLTEAVTDDVKVNARIVTLYADWTDSTVPGPLDGDNHFAYIQGYEDGTVRPDGNITRSEVAAIFFRLLTGEVRDANLSTSNPFSDVETTAWYNRAVSTLYQLGIIKGADDGDFHPDDTITRAEFAAIAARFSDKKVSDATPFTDLANHWAKDEVTAAASLGWVNGYTDGTFRPDQPITRAEAMTLVNRVLNRTPKSVDDLLDSMVTWPDNADSSKWYYLAVQEATNSHDYKASDSSESWTKLTQAPDWSKYEH